MAVEHQIASDDLDHLVEIVALGYAVPTDRGPVVVTVFMGKERVVQAAYERGEEADATTREVRFKDTAVLRPLVEKLVEQGKSFTTLTGGDDLSCRLKWTIGGR